MSFFSEYATVQKILGVKHPVIFFAETRHYYQYFEQLITDLLDQKLSNLVYITSDKTDSLLTKAPEGLSVFYVRWWLAFLFPRLRASVLVMTMPDLNNHAFKRSKEVGTYVYIFHAAVSTHQQYTPKAFYHYDAIFITGPYQLAEISATEKKYSLPKKDLVAYGYPVIDALEEKMRLMKPKKKEKDLILIAPSWFTGCIFDSCINSLVEQLSLLPYLISIRPHPEYTKRKKTNFEALRKWASKFPMVSFDYSTDVVPALLQADVLITDRSGIAFEYALGIGKPVLFIDTLPKIVNPNWRNLKIEPIENQVRNRMGISIVPAEINIIDKKLAQLKVLRESSFAAEAGLLKKQLVYNNKSSRQTGAAYILSRCK
jgi:hypothetical protein